MCEKQDKINELELELSQVRKNYAEEYKLKIEANKLNSESWKLNAEANHLEKRTTWMVPGIVITLVAAIFTVIGKNI